MCICVRVCVHVRVNVRVHVRVRLHVHVHLHVRHFACIYARNRLFLDYVSKLCPCIQRQGRGFFLAFDYFF